MGVTFQQIQKYESGANRICAGRLYLLAVLFGVQVGAFYEGLNSSIVSEDDDAANDNLKQMQALSKTRHGQELIAAYLNAPERVRRLALDLLKLGR